MGSANLMVLDAYVRCEVREVASARLREMNVIAYPIELALLTIVGFVVIGNRAVLRRVVDCHSHAI